MNKGLLSIAALLVAVVLFFAVNMVSGTALRGARVDLTEGKLYTLSEGSRAIARKLQEPIDLTLYYSEKIANDVPQIKSYAARVREMLTEFAQASGGKIRFAMVDPEPFSDAEDQAVAAGLVGQPIGRGTDRLYFGMVGKNSTDKQEVIPFFAPDREGFLEYDVTRIVHLLSDPVKKTVGIMTWLPMEGMPMNPMGGRGVPAWQILEQMKQLFEVKTVENSAKEIPDNIGVLMVVHPKGISQQTQYAIDQFVMRGGRLLLFVDPNCEQDIPPGMNPMQAMQIPKASELNTLLNAWGAEMDAGKIAVDRSNAVRVNVGPQNRPEPVEYIAWLNLGKDDLNASDPITGSLDSMIMATAGVLRPKEGATTQFETLVHTSTNSGELDASSVSFMPDPKGMLAKFESGGKELTLAARLTGKFKSAFADGPPAPAPTPDKPVDQLAIDAAKAAHLGESREGATVMVVADCDLLGDQFWIRAQRIGDIVLGYSKVSDNGDFVIRALDTLGGSSELMSLRARGGFARPFKRVEEIRRNAEDKYLKEEQKLQEKLKTTEQKISELQQKRPDGQATVLLTPEQEKEVADFRAEMVETRKELRTVQHGLRKDIEGLGTRLKALNMVAMPAVVGIAALGLSAYRLGRRKSDRLKAGRG
jgi:ABC-type uncharacterized transport system involved in gliding motility auxiliary subunit